MATPSTARDVPQIDIILLGSPGVGKATFLSRLPHVKPPQRPVKHQRIAQASTYPHNDATPVTSQTTLVDDYNAGERLSSFSDSQTTLVPAEDAQAARITSSSIGLAYPFEIRPLTGPLSFDVLLFARPYRITIHPSISHLFIDPFPASPSLLILTYSIPNRASLHNVRNYWMPQYHLHYPTSNVPTMLLGLQRDRRTAKVINATVASADGLTTTERQQYECVMPEEGLQAAREMRLDRYAECSALTGELMWEATQDLTKMAAQTTVDSGDYASEMCRVM